MGMDTGPSEAAVEIESSTAALFVRRADHPHLIPQTPAQGASHLLEVASAGRVPSALIQAMQMLLNQGVRGIAAIDL